MYARQNIRYVRDEPNQINQFEGPGFQHVVTLDKLPRPPPKKQGRAMVHYASDTMRHSNVELNHAAHYKKGWDDPN